MSRMLKIAIASCSLVAGIDTETGGPAPSAPDFEAEGFEVQQDVHGDNAIPIAQVLTDEDLLHELQRTLDDLVTSQETIASKTEELETSREKMETLEEKIEKLQKQIDEVEDNTNDNQNLTDENKKLSAALEKSETQKQKLETKTSALQKLMKTLTQKHKKVEQRLEDLRNKNPKVANPVLNERREWVSENGKSFWRYSERRGGDAYIKRKNQSVLVASIVILVLAFLGMIGLMVWFWFYRKGKRRALQERQALIKEVNKSRRASQATTAAHTPRKPSTKQSTPTKNYYKSNSTSVPISTTPKSYYKSKTDDNNIATQQVHAGITHADLPPVSHGRSYYTGNIYGKAVIEHNDLPEGDLIIHEEKSHESQIANFLDDEKFSVPQNEILVRDNSEPVYYSRASKYYGTTRTTNIDENSIERMEEGKNDNLTFDNNININEPYI